MFHAWWNDSLTTIGGMTDMALIYLHDYYGGGGSSQYYFEGYNVLGDASVVLVGGANTPPDTPDTPEGPDEGTTEVEYIFTTTTTDPEGEQVSKGVR